MFQNIDESTINMNDYEENKKEKKKTDILKNVLEVKNPIYILCFNGFNGWNSRICHHLVSVLRCLYVKLNSFVRSSTF